MPFLINVNSTTQLLVNVILVTQAIHWIMESVNLQARVAKSLINQDVVINATMVIIWRTDNVTELAPLDKKEPQQPQPQPQQSQQLHHH